MTGYSNKGTAFSIQLKDAINPDHPIPKRLRKHKRKTTTAEHIADKLWNAEQRRKALLNTKVRDTWHLIYDRRKSINNAISYEVCMEQVQPDKENQDKMLQEIRDQKLKEINEKQRRAHQRRKAFFKQRSEKRQKAHIRKTQSSEEFACFEVSFEEKPAESRVPLCVASPRRRHKLTVEELEEKQRRAEERRKFLEEAKVAKARQMEQETLQFNQAVSCLLGSQTSLTRREVSQHMKTIIVGLGKVKASMQRDLQLAERCHQLNMELQHAQMSEEARKSRRGEKRHRVPSGGNSVAFYIPLEEERLTLNNLPEHLAARLNKRRSVTAAQLEDKQRRAADRRKAHEAAKLEHLK